ncbi:MAG: hypothetical protein D6808_08120 [Candidatus Dadabacteria bacterium]|nr:MAG: hypothetical protein D6808_08120 [Candidatus Dadabacteria bacterium]
MPCPEPNSVEAMSPLDLGRDPSENRVVLNQALGITREFSPISGYVEEGEHTPGFCLDRVVVNLSPDTRTCPGIKALLFDGVTQHGADIWAGIRNPERREELTGGYVVEHAPELLLEGYREGEAFSPTLASLASPLRPLALEDCRSVVTLAQWLMPDEDGEEFGAVVRNSLETFLKPGLSLFGNVYLFDNGVMLQRTDSYPPKEIVVPIGDKMPRGFSRNMFNKGILRRGEFDREKLLRKTYEYLKRRSPSEVLEMMVDSDRFRLLFPTVYSMYYAAKNLTEGFEKAFKGALDLPKAPSKLGASTVAGVVKLPEGEGVLVFATSDSPAIVLTDGKVAFVSERLRVSNGICVVMDKQNRADFNFPRYLSYTIVPEDVARRSIFLLFSDGIIPNHDYDLELFLSQIHHCTTAKDLIDYAMRFGKERDEHWNNETQGRHMPDDKSAIAIEGAVLYD